MSIIKDLAELIRSTPENIFFTGAGISTKSGIPDYRSPSSGLWTRPEAVKAVDISGFMESPKTFYEVFSGELYEPFAAAKPNIAHKYIAQIESAGKSMGVITQNIDGLHKKAGSRNIYELHGTMSTSSCLSCNTEMKTSIVFDKFMFDKKQPQCPCGGIIKPDITFFGEALPETALNGAFLASEECSLMIVVGSSLSVMPAAMLPKHAKDNGSKLVIINKTETPLDYMADIVINIDIAEVFSELKELWKNPA